MSRPEITSFSVPRRRKSELPLRPRPVTSYSAVHEVPQASQQRFPHRTSYHTVAGNTALEWQSFSSPQDPEHVVIDEAEYTDPFSESTLTASTQPPNRHVRRHSTLTQSVIDGFSAISRRLSISRNGPKYPQRRETPEFSRGSATPLTKRRSQVFDYSDNASTATSRPRTRGLLNSLNPRRRPSMPILNWKPDADVQVPEYTPFHHGVTTSRPAIPDFMYGGAGARASAARQNEAMANARATPLPTYDAATSSADMRDSESGIGITVDDYDRRDSMHAARCDPAPMLPAELLESIFSFLDAKSLLQAELVSSRWRDLSRSQVVWRKVFYREYAFQHPGRAYTGPSTPGLGKNVPGQDYRKLFTVRRLIDKRWDNGEAAAIYLNGHKDSVYCVQFDEGKIITGSRDNTIRVWDARTYQCVRKLGPPNNPRERVQIQRTEVEPQGVVPFFKMEATSPDPPNPTPSMWHQASVLCLQYDDEILVTGSSDFSCIVWSIKDDYTPMFRLLGHTAGVLDVCIDAHRIVTCSKDTTIKIWDRFTGRLLKTLFGHQGPVNAVQVRGNLLASASGDGMSKLWRMEDGLCIKEFHSRERGLACVEFSEDGRTIFAGGNDHVIYEYNTITGNVERELQGHTDLVRSLHLDTAHGRIVSGSYDHSIKIWSTKPGGSLYATDEPLQINLEGWTSSWMLAAKSNYRKIACASQDGRVVIVDFGYGIDGVHLVEA